MALPAHALVHSGPDTPPVIQIPAAATEAAFRELTQTHVTREVVIDTTARGAPRYRYYVGARHVTGAAEIHEAWTDVVWVRSGTAVLRTGPRITDAHREAPHEWRGTVIEQPQDRDVGPGDVLIIPAGVAHQYRPTGSAPFEYLTVKVPPREASR